MLLIDPNAPEERRTEILGQVESMINSGGKVVSSHDWGIRRLTFQIDHRPEAAYHLFQFESGRELLDQLNQSLKILDGVLRFRIIRLKPGAPPPPQPRTESARPEGSRAREEETQGKVAARAAADAPDRGDEPG